MYLIASISALALAALAVIFRLCVSVSVRTKVTLYAMALVLAVSGWYLLELHRQSQPTVEATTKTRNVSRTLVSQTCIECHQSRHESWHRTYHRTMTQEATPESVQAEFDGTPHVHNGVTTYMLREGDRYYMDTVDPVWLGEIESRGIPLNKAGPPRRRKLSVDRIVGSHWFQQMLHRDMDGRYIRLPMAYHIVERRWVHIDGIFLCPESGRFFNNVTVWNNTCVYCHNTLPVINPVVLHDRPKGYNTEVAELGISCEVCHGESERHIQKQKAMRAASQRTDSKAGDPTIVNPARLTVQRADDICSRCHGGTMPRRKDWDHRTLADPFRAGMDLQRYWHRPFSEAEKHLIERGYENVSPRPKPGPLDGRFWSDGTPLTTALEYQGLSLSACYQNGNGQMRCLTCHTMHGGDRNQMLKDGMRTNAACYQCHASYQENLTAHTHHAADSSGSLCYNCHMANQVYSLLDAHRSHRISIPRVADSVGTGKPHACNLCHLDKSLGWTQDQLAKWHNIKPVELSDDDRQIAASILHLARDDARTRAVVASAFAWPPAQQAGGTDWPLLVLPRVLDGERFQAVRYSAFKALRSLPSKLHADDYEYQGPSERRAAQVRELRKKLDDTVQPDAARYPFVPLTPSGQFAGDVFDRLLRTRKDPDVFINE